ncbi:hypothetical protein R6Q59_033632 [Mikania micrantha]
MLHTFIQSPREVIKLVNESLSLSSTSPQPYILEFITDSLDAPQQVEAFVSTDPQIQQQYQAGPMGFVDMLIQLVQGDQIQHHETQMPSTSVPNIESPKFIDPKIEIALEKIRKRPRSIRCISQMLEDCVGNEHAITCSSPNGMCPVTYEEDFSYVELLRLFCNDWLDATIIHLFAMYFSKLPNSKCAFFNPQEISGDICIKAPDCTKQHLLELYSLHRYIVYSINKQNYAFTYAIEEAFGLHLDWEMVKCVQQRNTWECGFCVIKHMYEFLHLYQHDFPENN